MSGMPALTFGDRNQKMAPLAFGCDKTVLIEGRPTGKKGQSQVFSHVGRSPKEKHPINPLMMGDESVLVSGTPIGYLGVFDFCKHQMVFVQNKTVLVKGV
jgi:hypothetical protein